LGSTSGFPWYGSTAYEVLGNQVAGGAGNDEDFKVLRVGLGIRDMGGVYLSGVYEKQENIRLTKNNKADLWQVQAGYKFGNNMIKGMYGQKDLDLSDTEDKTSWAAGIDHSFTKRTTAYLLYTAVDVDNEADQDLGDWSGFSLGMIHKF